ncbi:FAD-binding oxidoreductase [Pseudomonas sp. SGAir0191]|uniref:NAD(P)/FAD-dependent oxidoreductase n=1 Tax=Pseudomonas sp. SGAir0191 TaxID=2217867 RepID=UPI000C2CD4E0|nr:FAD-binding oxidoreductase [Pseudomonas sp. SGAir0191]AUA33305.1 FAD-binding oxidoreductase [Pseudomonas sp. SGAir0191]
MKPKIGVMGAGVIGLSVARELALKGAQVTLFESEFVGGGTSSTTYAWINSNGKSPLGYHHLNVEGMREHRRLQEQNSGRATWLHECGTLEWATDSEAIKRLTARALSLQSKEYPAHLLSINEMKRLIPELIPPASDIPVWSFPTEAVLFPTIFLAFLRSELERLGVTIYERHQITDITEYREGVSLKINQSGSWEGDFMVSAVGRWTASVLGKANIQIAMIDADQAGKIGCSFLGYTTPAQIQLRSNLITSELNIRPDGGGRLLLQAPDLDHAADPKMINNLDGDVGRELLARLGRVFHNTREVRLERLLVGQRCRPADGLPAIGYVSGHKRLYVIATHSGMTLAPVLGKLAAQELIEGERSPLLKGFTPNRLMGKTSSDFKPIETIHFPAAQ